MTTIDFTDWGENSYVVKNIRKKIHIEKAAVLKAPNYNSCPTIIVARGDYYSRATIDWSPDH